MNCIRERKFPSTFRELAQRGEEYGFPLTAWFGKCMGGKFGRQTGVGKEGGDRGFPKGGAGEEEQSTGACCFEKDPGESAEGN